jgi:hypothetical protein
MQKLNATTLHSAFLSTNSFCKFIKNRKIMKKSFNGFFFCIILTVVPFLTNAQKLPVQRVQLWTVDQVKEMAKKYKLQDSVTASNRFFLVYENKQTIDNYLKEESEAIKAIIDLHKYLSKTKYVKTYEDYVKLVNSFPTIRASVVKAHGGEVKHQKYIAAALKFKWRIYRKEQGALSFERADLPVSEAELTWGKRIDTLVKE